MTYIVWTDHHTEGWGRSDDLDTIGEVQDYLSSDLGPMGHRFVVTQVVPVALVDLSKDMVVPNPELRPVKDQPRS